jgi:hypothetical protein
MPATQPTQELRALCYEHHVEMRLNVSLLNSEQEAQQTLTNACTEPDCLVHYNISRGYFMPGQNGTTHERDTIPSVRCLRDGMPMYLAAIDQERRAFRLWECPQCGGRQTNEDGLVGLASKEVQEVSGKFGVESQTPGSVQI